MDTVRIGHITDLHLRHYTPGSSLKQINRSREMVFILQKALQRFKNSGVDLVVITGDLVDSPAAVLEGNDYYINLMVPFRDLIRKDYQMIRAILEQADIPWMVLPGNSDTPDLFREVFGDRDPVREIRAFRFVAFHDLQWEGGFPRRIDRERRLMEDNLKKDGHPRQIHLQHFLVRKGHRSSRSHRYLEWENIRDLARDSGKVLLSLSGHYPPGVPPRQDGKVSWYAAPSLCRFPHIATVHQLQEDGTHLYTEEPLEESPLLAGKPVVIMNRDTVITPPSDYISGPDEMALIPGSARAIQLLKNQGYTVMINSGRPFIGNGYLPGAIVELCHDYMCLMMTSEEEDLNAQPDAIFRSTEEEMTPSRHSGEDITPDLPERIFEQFQLKREESWVIGGREEDLISGITGGISPLLVLSGRGEETAAALNREDYPDLIVKRDLLAAAEFIVNNRKSRW